MAALVNTIIAALVLAVIGPPLGLAVRKWMINRRVMGNPMMRVGQVILNLRTADGQSLITNGKIVKMRKGRIWIANEEQLLCLTELQFSTLVPVFSKKIQHYPPDPALPLEGTF